MIIKQLILAAILLIFSFNALALEHLIEHKVHKELNKQERQEKLDNLKNIKNDKLSSNSVKGNTRHHNKK